MTKLIVKSDIKHFFNAFEPLSIYFYSSGLVC